jgi:hypothetical protein
MIWSSAIEVAIGVSTVLFLISTLCASILELVESIIKKRADFLEEGIRGLLQSRELKEMVYKNPLISGLRRKTGGNPSYIPAGVFVLALINVLTKGDQGEDVASVAAAPNANKEPPALQKLRSAVQKFKSENENIDDLKSVLLTLMDDAQGDMDKLRTNIESWYNATMDRVAGWYKRRVQWLLFAVGLLMAALMNVDALAVAHGFARDPALRSSLTAVAQELAKTDVKAGEAGQPSASGAGAQAPAMKLDSTLQQIQSLGLPIGWSFDASEQGLQAIPTTPKAWLFKVFGWLLTAIGVALGAPFWFDIMNKFTVLRSTVKPHEKSPEEESED